MAGNLKVRYDVAKPASGEGLTEPCTLFVAADEQFVYSHSVSLGVALLFSALQRAQKL